MPTRTAARSRSKPAPASARRRRRPPAARKARQIGRKFGRDRKRIGNRAHHFAGRRGAVWGVFSLTVAAAAFTLAAAGAVSEIAAWELGFATDGLALGVSWIVGDLRKPADQSHLKRAATAATSRAAVCGAPTVDGTSCKNRGRCPHHKGGAKGSRKAPGNAPGQPAPPAPKPTGPQLNKGVPGTTGSTRP